MALFLEVNGSMLRHLEVPEHLWPTVYEALHDGVPEEAELEAAEAGSHDCWSQHGDGTASRAPYGGVFAFAVRPHPDDPAAAGERRGRTLVATQALSAASRIWAVSPLLSAPSCARLLSALASDTAALVRLAEALSYDDGDDDGDDGSDGDGGDGGAEEGEGEETGCGGGAGGAAARSVSEVLMDQIRPRLVEVVSEYELPPAPGAPPHKFKYLLPPLLAAMSVSSKPGLAVAPFPHWAGPRCRDFRLALLAWPVRHVEAGEEVSRCRLPLGLADFSSYGYWAASYKEAADTHEWYTEAGAMAALMQALTRLAPPQPQPQPQPSLAAPPPRSCMAAPPPPPHQQQLSPLAASLSAAAADDPWVAGRVLVAGCGNSALGYDMWQQAGYPAVDNVDYVPEVVRLMDEMYGEYGSELRDAGGGAAAATAAVAAAAPPCGSDGGGHGDSADDPTAPEAAEDRAAPSAAAAAEAAAMAAAAEAAAMAAAAEAAAAVASRHSFESSACASDVDGGGGANGVGGRCSSDSDSDGDGSSSSGGGGGEAAPDARGGCSSGGSDSGCSSGTGAAAPSRLRPRHGGAVRWLVGDLTDMAGTPDGSYDLVVDKATLDALMSPAVGSAAAAAGGSSGATGGGGGGGAAGGGDKWRVGAKELRTVYQYLTEMHRVTAPAGRLLILTLRPPAAIRSLLQGARAAADAATGAPAVAAAESGGSRPDAAAGGVRCGPPAPCGGGGGGCDPWVISRHEPFSGGRDGQELPAHLYVLSKQGGRAENHGAIMD